MNFQKQIALANGTFLRNATLTLPISWNANQT